MNCGDATSSSVEIRVRCVCGRAGQVPAKLAGRTVRCPACGARAQVIGGDHAGKDAPSAPGRGRSSRPKVLDGAVAMSSEWSTVATCVVGMSTSGRDLSWERHVRAVSVYWRVTGLLAATVCGLWACVLLATTRTSRALVLLPVLFAAVYGVAPIVVSRLLWRYEPKARTAALVLALALAISTNLLFAPGIWSGHGRAGALCAAASAVAWASALCWLFAHERTKRIFAPGYATLVERSRAEEVAWQSSPFFALPAALVASNIVLGVVASVV